MNLFQKFGILILVFSSSMAASPTPPLSLPALDFASLCSDEPLKQSLVVIDNGFCQHYFESQLKFLSRKSMSLNNANCGDCDRGLPAPVLKDRWKIRFYASHSFTTYFNSDLKIDSSRYQIEVKDYSWAERGSREFFNPKTWSEGNNNPLQMIDEPSNTFTVSIEKDGNEFFLSAFHPKFLQGDNSNKQVTGTIDGTAVNGMINLNTPFHGYVNVPGESKIVRNQNTHLQMTFEGGYAHRFKLLENKKLGSLTYVPGAGAGVMTGANLTVVVKENQWWDFDEHLDSFGIQGYGGSLTNRLEFNSPKERFGLFYENKLGYYKIEHGFLDGTQKYDLKYMGNSVGMKFMIYNPNRKKTPLSP